MQYQARVYGITLALVMQAALAETNLVTDGGFESGGMPWSGSAKSNVALSSSAAFSGTTGLSVLSSTGFCVDGALYTLNAAAFQPGTLYEFGARTRLGGGTAAGKLFMGLIKNGAAPVYLDGYAASSMAYPDRWTRLFGAYLADFAPTDSLKLCISGGKNIPTYLDDVFVRPLTTGEIDYQAPTTLDREQLVQADANRLVKGSAKTPLQIRGINVEAYDYGNDVAGGELALDNFGWKNYDQTSFQEIAGLGFNTVRLMMSFVVFEDNAKPGVYKDEGWAWLDRNIQWAKQNHLYLLLDMHEPPGGTQLPNQLGLTTTTKQRLENLWVAIAQRYRNETTVLGYDLLNEPYTADWFAYLPTLIGKIRAVDPDHLIYVQNSYHPADLGVSGKMYPLPFNNLVYDLHYYDSFASTDTGTTPYASSVAAFKTELMDSFLPFYDDGAGVFAYPLNVGEYGVVHGKYAAESNLGAEQWLADLSTALDAYGIDRMLFAYHEGRFGLYRGWHTYPGESTTLNLPLQGMIQALNGRQVSPGTDSFPAVADFTAKTAVPLGTAVESDPITVAEIDTPAAINVYKGSYSVNGAAYVSTPGTVKNGDEVQAKHTSAANHGGQVSTKLIIGGAVAYFTSTTQTSSPDKFSFAAKTAVPPSTVVDSAAITITGINAAVAISISAGSFYSVNGGAFVSTAGTVNNGDNVVVRHTASASYATTVTTTLTVGGVTGAFKSTTAAEDTKPQLSAGALEWDAEVGRIIAIPLSVLDSEQDTFTILGGPGGYSLSAVYDLNGLPSVDLQWTPALKSVNKLVKLSLKAKETMNHKLTSNSVGIKIRVWPVGGQTDVASVGKFTVTTASWHADVLTLAGKVVPNALLTPAERSAFLAKQLDLTITSAASGNPLGAPLPLSLQTNGSWKTTMALAAAEVPCKLSFQYAGRSASRSLSRAPKGCLK